MAVHTLHEQVGELATQGNALELAAVIVGAESRIMLVDYRPPDVMQLGTLGLAASFPETLGLDVRLGAQPAIMHRSPKVMVPSKATFAIDGNMELLEVDAESAAVRDDWSRHMLGRFAATYLAARHLANLPPVTILPSQKASPMRRGSVDVGPFNGTVDNRKFTRPNHYS